MSPAGVRRLPRSMLMKAAVLVPIPFRRRGKDASHETSQVRLEREGRDEIDRITRAVEKVPWSVSLLQILWTAGPVTLLGAWGGYLLGYVMATVLLGVLAQRGWDRSVLWMALAMLLGNILPLWDDPLWLVEQLATIDMISRGRLVSGWVRGTGRESVAHNAPPAYNWERFQEAHDFIVKAWTTPGPFRWEGKHFHYRYVNPWVKPYQKPHPPIWLPGVVSKDSLIWAANNRFPYIMLATKMEPTRQAFQLYYDTAAELGYEAGPQNIGYLWKVHVDETEELAEEVGRKYVQGPSNPFLAGNEGTQNPALMTLPGLTSRTRVLPTRDAATTARGGQFSSNRPYEDQTADYTIISGTPKTVLPKIRHVLEYLRPGSVFFWDGDGAMTHDDQMRSLRLMGEEVIPAVILLKKASRFSGAFIKQRTTGVVAAKVGPVLLHGGFLNRLTLPEKIAPAEQIVVA